MAKIDLVGTAENTVALGLAIAVGVVVWYVWKGTKATSDAVGGAVDKIGNLIANPLSIFPAIQGNPSTASKVVTDLANINENGTLQVGQSTGGLPWDVTSGPVSVFTPAQNAPFPPDQTAAILDGATPIP